MFFYCINHCYATGYSDYMLEIAQTDSDSSQYGKHSEKGVKSPSRYLSEL